MKNENGKGKESESEIQRLLHIVVQARAKAQEVEHDIEQARKTQRAIKETNDERMRKIQEENQELNSELAAKEVTLNKAKTQIENQVWGARAKLLRRITLCNLKNLIAELQVPIAPENILSTIYMGRFLIIYDDIDIGSKPVNQYEWKVRIQLAEELTRSGLLEHVWAKYRELNRGYGDNRLQFYQRDFKSEEDAKGYGERNRARICQKLIEGIKQVEHELEMANANIDEVFDFRLLIDGGLDPQYAHSVKFRVLTAEKHQLIVAPLLSSYDIVRARYKIQPYTITVTQQGYQLTIAGHRFPRQAADIKYAIRKHLNTEFKAIDSDTQQEIHHRFE